MPPRYIAVPFLSTPVLPIPTPGITVTPVSGSQINVSINYAGPPGATSYSFEKSSNSNGPFSPLASGTSNSFSDTGLPPSTIYFYRGKVQVVDGRFSDYTPIGSASTLASPPITPTGVTATDIDQTSISIQWQGVPGAVSYNLYTNGVLSDTGITGNSFTDTGLVASTTYSYQVSAVNSAGESAPSAPAQATTSAPSQPGSRIKFNPSAAYWMMDYNSSYSTQIGRFSALKSACPQTRGFEVEIPWAHLENPSLVGGTAQYDGSWATGDQTVVSNQRGFKLVDSFINAAAALGCQLMLHIRCLGGSVNPGTVSSTSFPSSFVPSYLQSSAYGPVTPSTTGEWGGVWVNAPTTSANQVRFAYYVRWWDTRVTNRLKAWGAAYGARYDANPNLETVGWGADENVVDPFTGCTDSGQIGSLLGNTGLLASWRASFPHTQCRLWANYYQTVATMDTFLAEAVARDWSIGGPDTCNDAPVTSSDPTLNSDGRYRSVAAAYRWLGWTAAGGDGGSRNPSLPAYNGQGHCICQVEWEDTAYDTVTNTIVANSRALGDGILPHIVNQANRLGSTHMVWADNTFSGRDAVRTNTAHPNLCDFVSSVCQGGINVNGVAAGITLQNSSYPPTFPQ